MNCSDCTYWNYCNWTMQVIQITHTGVAVIEFSHTYKYKFVQITHTEVAVIEPRTVTHTHKELFRLHTCSCCNWTNPVRLHTHSRCNWTTVSRSLSASQVCESVWNWLTFLFLIGILVLSRLKGWSAQSNNNTSWSEYSIYWSSTLPLQALRDKPNLQGSTDSLVELNLRTTPPSHRTRGEDDMRTSVVHGRGEKVLHRCQVKVDLILDGRI
jgi:hypothetical protein